MNHADYFQRAAAIAQYSLCRRSRCGALIVPPDGQSWAGSFNGPPDNDIKHRRCGETSPCALKPKSDRTCCVHAEQRAIIEALQSNFAHVIERTTLYFIRIDDQNHPQPSGYPYCTVCSRLALDVRIARWALWHEDGIRIYGAEEYNDLSHDEYAGTRTPPQHIPVVEQWSPR